MAMTNLAKEQVGIDSVIGANMAKLRIGHGTKHRPDYSQTRVAEQLRYFTGDTWNQSQVSLAEQGRRQFTVVDLFAIATIFDVSPLRLLHTWTDTTIRFGRIAIREPELLNRLILEPRLPLDQSQTTEPPKERT